MNQEQVEIDKDFWEVTWKRPYGNYNRHHQAIWEAIFPFLKGKIVDLGCGPAMIYKDKQVDVTGVDWSEAALAEAKKNYPKGRYILADATATGLPAHGFDTVVMFGLLDYFDPWDKVLEEAERLVKPDGIILGTLLNGFNNHDWKRFPRLTGNWHLMVYKGNIFRG